MIRKKKLNEWLHNREVKYAPIQLSEAWQACLDANPEILGLDEIWQKAPEKSKGCVLVYSELSETAVSDMPNYIKYIPRPVEQWEPKEGEWVFVFSTGKHLFKEAYVCSNTVKNNTIAAIIDFEAEKDQPWEYFVNRGKYRELK